MKNTILISSIFFVFVFGCNSPTQKVEKATEDLKDAKQEWTIAQQDSIADYHQFMNASRLQIDANDKAIALQKASLNRNSRNENAQKRIDELEQKNIDMRKKMNAYKMNGKDEWEDFKREFKYDLAELGAALKNIGVKNTR